jgi:glycosyltransferase involved in cell wall biosynthesis
LTDDSKDAAECAPTGGADEAVEAVPPHTPNATATPQLSVLIPVFNEKATVREILERVLRLPLDLEVVVVDDGSTDGSREILQGLDDPRVRAHFHEKNQGKGMALRTAMAHARGEILAVQDADLEYRPEELVDLVKPIAEGKASVVYGSRCLNPDNDVKWDRFRFGSWVLTKLTNLLYGARLTDEPTCYKLFHRDAVKDLELECTGFEFCPEITAKVLKRGHAILELPISYRGRTVAEGKKINWKDGVIGIWTLLRYRIRG